MPMGGMGGFGRGGMMGGGMMGAGGGQAGGVVESGLRRKWVSDEAVFCVNTYASHGQAGGQAQDLTNPCKTANLYNTNPAQLQRILRHLLP